MPAPMREQRWEEAKGECSQALNSASVTLASSTVTVEYQRRRQGFDKRRVPTTLIRSPPPPASCFCFYSVPIFKLLSIKVMIHSVNSYAGENLAHQPDIGLPLRRLPSVCSWSHHQATLADETTSVAPPSSNTSYLTNPLISYIPTPNLSTSDLSEDRSVSPSVWHISPLFGVALPRLLTSLPVNVPAYFV